MIRIRVSVKKNPHQSIIKLLSPFKLFAYGLSQLEEQTLQGWDSLSVFFTAVSLAPSTGSITQ